MSWLQSDLGALARDAFPSGKLRPLALLLLLIINYQLSIFVRVHNLFLQVPDNNSRDTSSLKFGGSCPLCCWCPGHCDLSNHSSSSRPGLGFENPHCLCDRNCLSTGTAAVLGIIVIKSILIAISKAE